ncbi:hypothetical protein BIZ37_20545 [Photobacterium sp. BZF1]|uniref:hypothetical protein n=1 Tax=Photobacterium sp. BZF1 TaxID=1904457 RepID=UPI001653ACCD|nr:hypothetical protein [Photobacterium sp. BZF1]MBC7004958.1 hypothetical protein [Photobacterium sp. BZF1]
MNRLMISAALLAFSTTALADLTVSRSDVASWAQVSYQEEHAVNAEQTIHKVETAAKPMKVKQLAIPTNLKDARKGQSNFSSHSI